MHLVGRSILLGELSVAVTKSTSPESGTHPTLYRLDIVGPGARLLGLVDTVHLESLFGASEFVLGESSDHLKVFSRVGARAGLLRSRSIKEGWVLGSTGPVKLSAFVCGLLALLQGVVLSGAHGFGPGLGKALGRRPEELVGGVALLLEGGGLRLVVARPGLGILEADLLADLGFEVEVGLVEVVVEVRPTGLGDEGGGGVVVVI